MTPHPERQYLDALARAWAEGDERRDRTGVGTRSLFGVTMRFDLSDGTVPLLTTKRIFWKSAVKELIWFLSGDTNIRPLVEQGVHIWTDWPLDRYRRATGEAIDRDAFEARIVEDAAFAREWGDLGPVYGRQWVAWPDGQGGTINQIERLVDGLRNNPASRRHIFTGWNVAELDRMALPPCHMTYQYHVADGRLSGILYQRSCDLGLGFPELGTVSVRELEALRGPFGLGVQRDDHFDARMTLSAYAADARRHGRIRARGGHDPADQIPYP